ncbi:hypothetical protein OG413_20050 [Streptomyces sp. NBC_01433]|uniref:hypothetical protein n=1 Tax=Streptomyces sp. NBC_01433 TaxID=2903864 RepID=UPI00225C0AC9|nr:hypothetical protein [Streptomyces sp. NBC_01433]MCX4677568.1 hypothetical protein [Streptomyces sp. NBC_01433]
MTACAIEGETAGAAATVEPVPEESGEPEEPGAPTAALGEPETRDAYEGLGACDGLGGYDGLGASDAFGAADASGAFVLTADASYAARLTAAPGHPAERAWYPERWTLDGPEPYAVPLPLDQPEEPDSQVVPLADGRVLIRRRVADLQAFSLLYPTGPGTGELPLGAVECADLTLLPPSPDGRSVYALAAGERSTALWLVAGGAFGPERITDVPGHCSGGVWLDRAGRMLALDRQPPDGGPVKAVALDLGRGGEVTPLLQITPDSDDRLLLADTDSGLLLLRSDAPGHDRLGWGVLGSCLPVRFPECLRPADVAVTPFAVQPGQMLMPESCAVGLRIDGAAGSWVGVWRPAGRRLHQFAAPRGWLAGAGFWSRDGMLHLPCAEPGTRCAVALLEAPSDEEPCLAPTDPAAGNGAGPGTGDPTGTQPSAAIAGPVMCRPVPLGQAPLKGRTASV